MALSGLDIFKLLPKTNCGDCGVPTCMAFAMKLAQKKAELSQCPHASEEAKAALGASSEPPIRLVKIGGSKPLHIGNETVMFRHEKTFFHPPGVAVELRTSENREKLLSKIKEVEHYKAERIGEELKADLFFVHHDSDHSQDLLTTIQSIKQTSSKGIILHCSDKETLKSGLELLKNDSPA
ncbi:MAG: (Fe-S)-binding protein, partial [Candidatus Aminicenantales bacterium]